MGEIIDVKPLKERLKKEIKDKVFRLKSRGTHPKVAFLFSKENKGADIFHRILVKLGEELGILTETIDVTNLSIGKIKKLIEELNRDPEIRGIFPIRPLGSKEIENEIFSTMDPEKDIECLTHENIGRLFSFSPKFIPSTPNASFEILKFFLNKKKISIKDYYGKVAVIVGRSITVGRPLYILSLMNNLVPINLHSKVSDISRFTKIGDIIFSCAGVPHLVKKDMVKEGSIIIDIGINVTEEGVVGDVDTKGVVEKALGITPVPGGVGEITNLFVFKSLLSAYKLKI